MQKIKHNRHVIEIFETPEELSIKRFQRFNKFLMIDVGVGSSFADFDKRSIKAIEYLKKDMKEDALKELENRRQMVYNAFMEYSPKDRAFAILVNSIDGIVFKDYSKTGLENIINHLEEIGFSKQKLDNHTNDIKKKSKPNLKHTFLQSFQRMIGKS